jgi:hypothetical protein
LLKNEKKNPQTFETTKWKKENPGEPDSSKAHSQGIYQV